MMAGNRHRWTRWRRDASGRARRVVSRLGSSVAWNGRWLRARVRRLRPGVTVVVVNFNGDGLVQPVLEALGWFAGEARILVVDNASTDGSAGWLRRQREASVLSLRRNIGHGPALDRGFHRVATTHAIALDVDAFPVSDRWLRTMLGPLEDPEVLVVGPETWRPYAHPCSLALRTADFIRGRMSFRTATYGGHWRDVGEVISAAHPGRARLLPQTEVFGRGNIGVVYADVVYHNCYGTRFSVHNDLEIDGVNRGEVAQIWHDAVAHFLGPRAEVRGEA